MVEHDNPVDQWRINTFGAAANTAAASDQAQWNANGVANLVAYALAIDPFSPTPVAGLPTSSASSPGSSA